MNPKVFALNPNSNDSSHDHRVTALEVCDNIISIQRSFGSRISFIPRTLWRILW
ncbi:unnamed protein product [Acanthoscelides obtectus]|uniref:Uncharacterized protein n=1 Tax=Acanthoscelides obtectus TaxID=200917 RepID=A0A9P0JSE2_ACAOB|nr:unnamed protein product [Acanthoscelides obtectus]CAK1663675.1 hypothetical protein AOBTE_LOCUS23792 [Acanthoscelides obtectus]